MKIGVDIDDVLYAWFDRAHEKCIEQGLVPPDTPRPQSWRVHEDYKVTLEQWIAALEPATLDGSLYDGAPIPGVLRSLERLVEHGHSIHLVTARGWLQHGKTIKAHTVHWLEAWEIPYSSLTFAQDKTILGADIFVDDSPRNYRELWAAWKPCYLVDQTWNQEVDDIPSPKSFRVRDFNHFADTVIAMEAP